MKQSNHPLSNKEQSQKGKIIALTGVLMALTIVATMVVTIPIPQVNGYINVGDAIIFIAGALFGPWVGAIVGGVGSATADILLSYGAWAPFTLVIKGLEGLVVGLILHRCHKNQKAMKLLAFVIGGIIMVVGYFVVSIFLYGFEAALLSSLPNVIQAVVSLVIAFLVTSMIKKH